jgi:uncharacterized protein YdeI (YjbR/CyaY-like superfamily)
MEKDISHKVVPEDFKKALSSSSKTLDLWESITPLAKNEWICWVTSAKKIETRERRIKVAIDKILSGMRRPCCFEGCSHRLK